MDVQSRTQHSYRGYTADLRRRLTSENTSLPRHREGLRPVLSPRSPKEALDYADPLVCGRHGLLVLNPPDFPSGGRRRAFCGRCPARQLPVACVVLTLHGWNPPSWRRTTDDVAYISHSINLQHAELNLQRSLDLLQEWLSRWWLTVNVGDTQVIAISEEKRLQLHVDCEIPGDPFTHTFHSAPNWVCITPT